MTDSDISQWIGLASLAIPVLVWLSIALVVRRALGRFGLQGGGSLLGRWFPKWRWVMRVLVSLFTGLMIATAVGAVFPRVILPAASLICDGSVELLSQGYSYKPGQSGVSHRISCIAADGSRTSITLATVGVAFLLYSAAVFVLLSLWHLVSGGIARRDDGTQDFRMPGATMPPGPSFTGSPLGSADRACVQTAGSLLVPQASVVFPGAPVLCGLIGLRPKPPTGQENRAGGPCAVDGRQAVRGPVPRLHLAACALPWANARAHPLRSR